MPPVAKVWCLLAPGLAIGVVACGVVNLHSADGQHLADSQQEAGTVQVTPIAIGHWDDYVDLLSPQFNLTTAGALKLVLPQTQTRDTTETATSDVHITVGLATPQSGPPAAGTTDQPSAGGKDTVKPGPAMDTSQRLTDPILTYQAATAIYQEAKLLEHYLSDAALRYGYVPLVVRLGISLRPFARQQPYDAYVTLSAFSRIGDADSAGQAVCSSELPAIVLPFLVTDDYEVALATYAANASVQAGLQFGGLGHAVPLQGGGQEQESRDTSASGADVNSLLSVARLVDNAVQLRIGASFVPGSGYQMLPSNHNLTLLVLVRREHFRDCAAKSSVTRQLRFISYARFRHATTGEQLPIDRKLIFAAAEDLLPRYSPYLTPAGVKALRDPDAALLKRLVIDISDQKLSEFMNDICPIIKGWAEENAKAPRDSDAACADVARAFWTALATVIGTSEYAEIFYDLPRTHGPQVNCKQLIVLEEGDNGIATAEIQAIDDVAPARMTAELRLADKALLSASHVAVNDASRSSLVLTFTGVGALRKARLLPKTAAILSGATLTITQRPVGGWLAENAPSSGCSVFPHIMFRPAAAKLATLPGEAKPDKAAPSAPKKP